MAKLDKDYFVKLNRILEEGYSRFHSYSNKKKKLIKELKQSQDLNKVFEELEFIISREILFLNNSTSFLESFKNKFKSKLFSPKLKSYLALMSKLNDTLLLFSKSLEEQKQACLNKDLSMFNLSYEQQLQVLDGVNSEFKHYKLGKHKERIKLHSRFKKNLIAAIFFLVMSFSNLCADVLLESLSITPFNQIEEYVKDVNIDINFKDIDKLNSHSYTHDDLKAFVTNSIKFILKNHYKQRDFSHKINFVFGVPKKYKEFAFCDDIGGVFESGIIYINTLQLPKNIDDYSAIIQVLSTVVHEFIHFVDCSSSKKETYYDKLLTDWNSNESKPKSKKELLEVINYLQEFTRMTELNAMNTELILLKSIEESARKLDKDNPMRKDLQLTADCLRHETNHNIWNVESGNYKSVSQYNKVREKLLARYFPN